MAGLEGPEGFGAEGSGAGSRAEGFGAEGSGAGAGAGELLRALAEWAAGDRASRAAGERVRTRALIEQSAGSATWTGLLVDLAEAAAGVVVACRGGSRLAGRIVGVARDFVALERPAGRPVLVRTEMVEMVQPEAGGVGTGPPGQEGPGRRGGAQARMVGRPGGARSPAVDLTLAGALDVLAGEQAPVAVRGSGGDTTGTVTACGADFLTLRLDRTGRRVVYLALTGVIWVELR